jgi:GNAT superfamily N-acetyltransferase
MMNKVEILAREMSPKELDRMYAGFNEHTLEKGVEIQTSDRFSYTAVLSDKFVGCVSGLAYKDGETYSGWFYVTDLFVEKEFRSQGLGGSMLAKLEAKLKLIGIQKAWLWTAGYEASVFYQKQGYEVFYQMEAWYSDGSSRIGLMKTL